MPSRDRPLVLLGSSYKQISGMLLFPAVSTEGGWGREGGGKSK